MPIARTSAVRVDAPIGFIGPTNAESGAVDPLAEGIGTALPDGIAEGGRASEPCVGGAPAGVAPPPHATAAATATDEETASQDRKIMYFLIRICSMWRGT